VACFGEPLADEPAWKQERSWYQVSTEDRSISPDGERFFARRMKEHTIELKSSHLSPVARPHSIAEFIKQAAEALA
jgi:hypothetical protein